MSESEEEKVDGAQVAADILLSMEPERRKRIMGLMASKSPGDAKNVRRKINNLSRLLKVNARNLEAALRKVTDNDIALAIKTENEFLKDHVYQHVSPRRKAIIVQTLKELPPTPVRVVAAAQQRLIDALDRGLDVVG